MATERDFEKAHTPHRSATDARAPDVAGREHVLHCTIVERSGRPDRCTLYPPGLDTDDERMTNWISVDRTVLIDLERYR
ncbi:MAG: hypothetical protein QXG03_06600 [Halalkalicoccus sp.]